MIRSSVQWMTAMHGLQEVRFGLELTGAVAEPWHAIGIWRLNQFLGIKSESDAVGIEDRRIFRVPGGDRWNVRHRPAILSAVPDDGRREFACRMEITGDRIMFAVGQADSVDWSRKCFFSNRDPLCLKADADVAGAWSDEAFAICGRLGSEVEPWVRRLFVSFREAYDGQASDVAVWFAKCSSLGDAGPCSLCVAFPQMAPPSFIQMVKTTEQSQRRLDRMLEDSRVLVRLDRAAYQCRSKGKAKADRWWYALHSVRALSVTYAPNLSTDYGFLVYIVPAGGGRSGIYTVEEIDAWIAGRGPVIKGRDGVCG